jgi:hypothetical protein
VNGPSVVLPAAPAYAATARLFVAAVARHYGVDEADVEDARLAVSEVFAAAMASRQAEDPEGSFQVGAASLADGMIGFRIEVPVVLPRSTDQAGAPGDRFEQGEPAVATSLRLVRSLFPDTTIEPGQAGRTVVEFSVALGERISRDVSTPRARGTSVP